LSTGLSLHNQDPLTGKYLTPQKWAGKISNAAQLGGIETSVLDNGAGRGTRVAWFNTGSGLRFKVVIDRCMDIAEAFYNEYSLAWLNHSGITPPQPFSHRGIDWLRTFGGGLLTTCGLSHVGGPEKDEFGERGLHGLVSNIPAEVESIQQPQPLEGKLEMSITGLIRETQIFGPSLDLKRTISASLGSPVLKIHDEVVNNGNTPAPHMLLYHCNFGWPLVDEGTDIFWKGDWKAREGDKTEIFLKENNFRKCPAPIEAHNGSGEEAAFINIDADGQGYSKCGLHNQALGIAVVLRFSKKQLPWLINWQHWGRGEYVTGLEPATNPPVGQAQARKQKELIILQPGEKRTYDLSIEVLTDEGEIRQQFR
jgi:hypothetical protein